MTKLAAAATLACLLAAPALAQVPIATPATVPTAATFLTVVAEGEVTRTPDVAELSGGVVTTAPTAAAAMAANARAMTAVVAALRAAGVAERDIQTRGLGLQATYSYEERQQRLTGYQATNTVALRLRDIAKAGTLLDALVKAGANQISGPSFRLDKPEAALDEARVQAVTTARARATLYAQAAGMTVKRIESISEAGDLGTPDPQPMLMRAAKAEMADAAPPVAPGEVNLGVRLTVRFELQ